MTDTYTATIATYYHPTDKGAECGLCPHRCHLEEGQYGLCRNRFCQGHTIYSSVYGRPCALHIDPVEKKPLLHFHPAISCLSIGTTGCNLSCDNCQNADISQTESNSIETIKIQPEELVSTCIRYNCPAIAYTYNEPITFYEYMFDSALLAQRRGIWNILVSAGYINPEPLKKLCTVIDAANIDLKSFSDKLYHSVNHASLSPVLDTLLTLKESGIWIEITNLIIPTINDDFKMIRDMCRWLVSNGFEETPLHFSRFYPSFRMRILQPTPLDTLTEIYHIAQDQGIKYVYLGNVAEIDGENTYCPSCGKLLIKRDGFNVLQNHIKESKCSHCGTYINGIW